MNVAESDTSFNFRLHQIAIVTIVVGASVGVLASAWALIGLGRLEWELFFLSASAAATAIPVYREYKRLKSHRDAVQ